MKLIMLMALGLLSVNAFAQDLAENHAQMCQGAKEPCQVIFAVTKKSLSGVCTGKLKNQTQCSISYVVGSSSAVRVMCGIQNEMMMVQGQSYHVSALVSRGEKDVLVNDPSLYTSIEGKTIKMFMARSNTSVAAQILIKDKVSSSLLTEVKCN